MISSVFDTLYRTPILILLLFTCMSLQVNAIDLSPYNQLLVKQINLKNYPEEIKSYTSDTEVTLGDLHGNALKLMNFLIRNEVLKISREDYKLFYKLYKKPPGELSKRDIDIFHIILENAEFSKHHKLRFLGDDLCDRGMNDYYTLAIYKALDLADVPFEIILSNHNHFFISAYEKPGQSFLENPYGGTKHEQTVQSMLNMGRLIEKGLIQKQEILDLVQHHYLKHLVLPGYTINKYKNEVTIYTHAPVDMAILADLAKDLDVPFNDDNINDLGKTLTKINNQIKQWLLGNTLNRHYDELNEAHKTSNTLSPLTQVLWNRNYSILNRTEVSKSKRYSINYVHGHDSMPNVFDLDNLLGKSMDLLEGPYAIHITHH